MDAPNLHQVFDWLWTSGQLSRQDILELSDLGVEVVINLALPTSSNALPGEAEMVTGLGLTYLQIPVEWEQPEVDQFDQFVAALAAFKGRRIWLHCALNMRVSAFVYLYRRLVLGEDEAAAAFPMREVWTPNEVWRAFIESVLRRGIMTEVIGIDHIYIAVSDMARAEAFYDRVLGDVLGFRKNRFALGGEAHVQYYNRHFGYVLRPARSDAGHDPYAPGLHHFCLRVESEADVVAVASQLRAAGIEASEARCFPEYAPDYWATFFTDPDGVRLEVTNYRQERRERHDGW